MAVTFRKTENGYLEVTTTREGEPDVVVLYTRPEIVSRLETKQIVQRPELVGYLEACDADIALFQSYLEACDDLGVTTNY